MSVDGVDTLMLSAEYSSLKKLFVECRAAFKANREAQEDLVAYNNADHSHEYTVLKGFVPASIVGNPSAGGGVPYQRADTFFTDFAMHHPESCVLSASQDSYIIGNQACYDVRLYSAQWDPSGKDRSSAAGMSFFHFMVIPKRRVYNAVCLEDPIILEEMQSHFSKFWESPGAYEKCMDRLTSATESRASAIRESLRQDQSRLATFDSLMQDVRTFKEECSAKLRQLCLDDFVFGVHPAPHASVGHLHMHVLVAQVAFRRWSTSVHDWKTVPVKAVVEAIAEEKKGG
ncbi:hypothetical protein OE88DRAFT_677021 [Heliocybe sulcata]|uniref:HIT-like protein n=1 Tax=Heliocybe sulcata TaxID=5364 RepID=A0A5C3NEZ7_9AGAM|nr:hypothetical protein OE88DRAFT_677021 [Heliocybe sulcata]